MTFHLPRPAIATNPGHVVTFSGSQITTIESTASSPSTGKHVTACPYIYLLNPFHKYGYPVYYSKFFFDTTFTESIENPSNIHRIEASFSLTATPLTIITTNVFAHTPRPPHTPPTALQVGSCHRSNTQSNPKKEEKERKN